MVHFISPSTGQLLFLTVMRSNRKFTQITTVIIECMLSRVSSTSFFERRSFGTNQSFDETRPGRRRQRSEALMRLRRIVGLHNPFAKSSMPSPPDRAPRQAKTKIRAVQIQVFSVCGSELGRTMEPYGGSFIQSIHSLRRQQP
jgi:hypothetical protein